MQSRQPEVAAQHDERRLLLVSYHFPPDRAVGAKRWAMLSKFALERGWGVDVFACGAAEATMRSDAVPDGVRVFWSPLPILRAERIENAVWKLLRPARPAADTTLPAPSPKPTPALQASSIARPDVRWSLHTPRGWMRTYWSALDFSRISAWGDQVEQDAATVFRPGVHRVVISSGPPFMSHDVGRRISQRLGIPFVMDMRDPWSHVERLAESIASPAWVHLAKRYEARAVRAATLIVTNTDVARKQMAATYPTRAPDVVTVMNGADDELLPPPRQSARFVVAHAGTIYLDRDPRALFVAAGRLIRELSLSPDDFGLEFIGELEAVGGFPIEQTARAEGIGSFVHTGPSRSHAGALEFMAEATMLLTMSGTNMAAIPAKTFECIRFQAWVLALSEPGSATDALLNGSGADVASPTDIDGILEILRNRFLQHRAGVLPDPIARDERLSRRYQAGVFFEALEARVK